MLYQNASPNAIFSTPSSDSNDQFTSGQTWGTLSQNNPPWPSDYNNQFTSPDALSFTPSPAVHSATPAAASSRGAPARQGESPLNIAPISSKSRVETQINVIMTLEKPPPGIENLHLPLHTIAKSKLLAKEPVDLTKTLELHTMLVCTSAIKVEENKARALQRARQQSNHEIQERADLAEDEKKEPKEVEELDKPANGGEVRICQNCINRERKRAGRKKLKKEEEQEHWQRYETERVVVFNSNEYLQFKPWDQAKDAGVAPQLGDYVPPEGSTQVTAAMRIACYCRHQSEKEGFQVIFTMKDQAGNVVAQEMSASILITDDHKTNPPQLQMGTQVYGYEGGTYPQPGMPTSYSMVDLQSHGMTPFSTSRSTGNLQALGFGAQFNPHSHIHQLPTSGLTSQATSATMTPNNLSRPASPTGAQQAGPNKKRKSSSFHRRVPSGLTMTPRVDTSQPPSSGLPSAMSMTSPFSPTGAGLGNAGDHPYITLPYNGGQAQYHGSGPPTPNENGPFVFNNQAVNRGLGRESAQNYQAFYSAPSSAHQSRASSPAQQSGPNLAAYARQHIHAQSHSMTNRPNLFVAQAGQASSGADPEPSPPMINKVIPAEGPVTGGQEISIHGSGFYNGMQVMFGDHLATATTFWSEKSLLCVVPPGRAGPVGITLVPSSAMGQLASPTRVHPPIYTYKDEESKAQMMEMALRFISQKQTGSAEQWQQMTQLNANAYISQHMGRGQMHTQGYDGNMLASAPAQLEESILHWLNHQRRGSRPSLHPRQSSASVRSTKESWDISSASFYESDAEESEQVDGLAAQSQLPASRRSSAHALRLEHTLSKDRQQLPATIAWRDSLAAQIHHLQQNVHWNIPAFQFPVLPPLPECQENVVRRISSLVPGRTSSRSASPPVGTPKHDQNTTQVGEPRFWDFFSSVQSPASAPPPAYEDIFPDKTSKPSAMTKQMSAARAVTDAVADQKCAELFDCSPTLPASSRAPPLSAKADRKDAVNNLSFLWVSYVTSRTSKISADPAQIPLVLAIVTSIIMHLAMPYIFAQLSHTLAFLRAQMAVA